MAMWRRAVARRSAAPTPLSSRPSATLSSTVRQGRSTGCWKTIPTSGKGSRTTVSRTRTVPVLTGVSPAISLSKVDLPQPLGPTSVTNSFSATSSVMFSSARTRSPRRVRYVFSTPWSRITIPPGVCGYFFAGRRSFV